MAKKEIPTSAPSIAELSAHLNVRITFIEPVLGSAPSDKEIYETYVGSKAPDASSIEDEIDSVGVDGVVDKGKTIFHRDENGNPFVFDYQIKGFFKGACKALRKVPGTYSSNVTAYKEIIDTLIFPAPRCIYFGNLKKEDITTCQRPLRAETAQGARTALAISEEIPAGTTLSFTVTTLSPVYLKVVEEWLGLAVFSGLGQWRNSGKGRFVYEILDDEGNVIGGNKADYIYE